MKLVLDRVNWHKVNHVTRDQVRNREQYCPPISLFRWWARRPHALIGALLDASGLPKGELVSDVFSGGGTVALEAVARGFKVYAQDFHPWVTWGLRTALDGISPETLERGISTFIEELESKVKPLYSAPCPLHGSSEVLHTFWVRECRCLYCGNRLYLFPYSLITVSSRSSTEPYGYYGCSGCGGVTRKRLESQRPRRCECGAAFSPERRPLLARRLVKCSHCSHEIPCEDAWASKVVWKVALIQRLCMVKEREIVHFDIPQPQEALTTGKIKYPAVPTSLRASIPRGRETDVLRKTGFTKWYELYPARQLTVLLHAAEVAKALTIEEQVRNRIQLAIASASEMAGYLCRWDRFHPKVFEAMANHRFSPLGLAVEINLMGRRGRGTLRRRLAASLKSARWSHATTQPLARQFSLTTQSSPKGRPLPCEINVACGSSSHQLLPDRSVGLMITDPPYYDSVQYGELGAVFVAWARVVKGNKNEWRTQIDEEAVPNSIRGTGMEHYANLLRKIFRETRRTLKPKAKLLLTYHSSDFRGWAALGLALHSAGLHVLGLATAHSENESDHPKRGRLVFCKDLVLECRTGGKRPKALRVVTPPRSEDEKELIAAGRAIALHSRDGVRAMADFFLQEVSQLRKQRIRLNGMTVQNGG